MISRWFQIVIIYYLELLRIWFVTEMLHKCHFAVIYSRLHYLQILLNTSFYLQLPQFSTKTTWLMCAWARGDTSFSLLFRICHMLGLRVNWKCGWHNCRSIFPLPLLSCKQFNLVLLNIKYTHVGDKLVLVKFFFFDFE